MYRLNTYIGNREAPQPLVVQTPRASPHVYLPSHLGGLRVRGRDPVRRRQRPRRGRERSSGVDGRRRMGCMRRRMRRRVRRRVVPARGRGEGLDGPVVAEGGRSLLL